MRVVIYVEGGLVQEVLYDRPQEKDGYGVPFALVVRDEDNGAISEPPIRYSEPILDYRPEAVADAFQEAQEQEAST